MENYLSEVGKGALPRMDSLAGRGDTTDSGRLKMQEGRRYEGLAGWLDAARFSNGSIEAGKIGALLRSLKTVTFHIFLF